MSRGITRTARPYVVWLGVTAAAAAAAHTVPGTWRAAADASASETIPQVLVAACATGLALSLAWLWVVTSVTVAEVVTGSVPRSGGAARRLVLLACGAAVVAGTALPAQASSGDGAEVLVGLPLPERAVAPATSGVRAHLAAATTADPYVVRSGDSLWSIARAHPAPAADVETRWRAIWRHNRDVVGGRPRPDPPGPGAPPDRHRHRAEHRAEQREGRRTTMSTPDSAEAEVILLRPSAGMASVQGALALDLTPRTAPPRPRLRSTRASDLADLERASREQVDAFVGRYLQAAVEIAAGDRPVAQLLRHTVPEVFDALSGRARTVTAAGGLAPGRVRGPNPARPVVVGVRTALIRSDAVEASAHVRYGRRSRAVAARFEVVRDRWQCVAITWG